MTSSTQRKPRIFLSETCQPQSLHFGSDDFQCFIESGILCQKLKQYSYNFFLSDSGYHVPGDIIISKDDSVIVVDGKRERLEHGNRIRVGQKFTAISSDVLDYFGEAIECAKLIKVCIILELPLSDKMFLNLGEYYKRKIYSAEIQSDNLCIWFSEYYPHRENIKLATFRKEGLENLIDEHFIPSVTIVLLGQNKCVENMDEYFSKYLYLCPCRPLDVGKKFTFREKLVIGDGDSKILLVHIKANEVSLFSKKFNESYGYGAEILHISPPFETLCFDGSCSFQNVGLVSYRDFVSKWKKKHLHEQIIDICIALDCFSLPKYVLLEILDWVPNIIFLDHRKKIDLIFAVCESISKIKQI